MNLIETITSNLSYNDFFSNVSTSLSTFTGKVQGIALTVIIACLVIAGIMYMLGEESAQKAKRWIPKIIIGAVIVFGAATLGATIRDISGF